MGPSHTQGGRSGGLGEPHMGVDIGNEGNWDDLRVCALFLVSAVTQFTGKIARKYNYYVV